MGMLPSASLAGVPETGKKIFGLYEPIHGSAPRRANQNLANPIATIMSAAMLLRYSLGLAHEAGDVEAAVAERLPPAQQGLALATLLVGGLLCILIAVVGSQSTRRERDALGLIAALLHWPIDERAVLRLRGQPSP